MDYETFKENLHKLWDMLCSVYKISFFSQYGIYQILHNNQTYLHYDCKTDLGFTKFYVNLLEDNVYYLIQYFRKEALLLVEANSL